MHSATRKFIAASIAAAFLLQGCANQTGANGAPASSDGGSGKTITEIISGTLGATVGLVAAEALAKSDAKRLKLSPKDYEKRKRGYMITFALLGFAAGSAIGGTVYSKLSERGKQEREKALQAAAEQARQQRYGEPTSASVVGTAIPGKRYAEAAANRECVDVEDTLTDGTGKDSVFVKMCRNRPNGGWQQVTA
jgi:hypothetical protein